MGATALQKYVAGVGSLGASSVGSSSSYSPKESSRDATPVKNVKTFKNVKGCDNAKQELEEVVEYLKNLGKLTRLGGKLSKGILLTGTPGTSKTLISKTITREAGVPFSTKRVQNLRKGLLVLVLAVLVRYSKLLGKRSVS